MPIISSSREGYRQLSVFDMGTGGGMDAGLQSDDTHGLEEYAQGAKNGDANGNAEHAKRESTLLFVSVVQFIRQTFNRGNDLLEAFIHLLEAFIHLLKTFINLFKTPVHICINGVKAFINILETSVDIASKIPNIFA